eukprot:g83221.t1
MSLVINMSRVTSQISSNFTTVALEKRKLSSGHTAAVSGRPDAAQIIIFVSCASDDGGTASVRVSVGGRLDTRLLLFLCWRLSNIFLGSVQMG